MGNQKPGFYENTSHSPVDSGKNPVSLVGLRKFGLSDFPEVRQGIHSLSDCRIIGLSNYRIIELTEKLTTIANNLLCAHPIKFNRV